jgi:phospholipase/carboxylesterase
MSVEPLRCVEVAPKGPARCAVIWLHGLGADGHDFEPIVPYLGLADGLGVRFVFPHAPKRAVTINMGLIMPAWYDIRDPNLMAGQDERGLRESAALVRDLVDRENDRGVPSRKIVLAGFSQGGALALHVALRHPGPLAGVVALSCYLVGDDSQDARISEAGKGLRIFQAHGTEDPLVPIERGMEARDHLVGLGCDLEWRTYPVGHEVHPEAIRHIGDWLGRRLSEALGPAGPS